MRGAPAYQRHGKEFPKLNTVSRAGIMAWRMKKAAKELDRARQPPVIQSQPVACESKEEEGEAAPVWAFVPARDALTVSEKRHEVSLTMNSRDSSD